MVAATNQRNLKSINRILKIRLVFGFLNVNLTNMCYEEDFADIYNKDWSQHIQLQAYIT